jgi:hypothetical protein
MKTEKALARMLPICVLTLIALAGLTIPALAQNQRHLFDLSANAGVIDREPWPVVPHSGMRMWDTVTAWSDISPRQGVYDWTTLDLWLAASKANGNDVLYTFGSVPQWASSRPHDGTCSVLPGACDPPKDVNPDGSGSDRMWKDYVTALVQHSQNSPTARITSWEMWNEPMNPIFWNGTFPQLLRMVRDAYTIIKTADPKAVIISPAFGWESKGCLVWMASYFAAGGGQYAEAIAVHGYVFAPYGKFGTPENIVPYYTQFRSVLEQYGQASKPIWDTEANWGFHSGFSDPDQQAAWLARFYTLHASYGIQRLYWFLYNGSRIGLWERDPNDPRKPGKLFKSGVAFAEVGKWLVGASFTACSNQKTVWTCGLSRSGAYQGQIIWDTSKTCNNGSCNTTGYRVSPKYVKYRNLDGKQISITNGLVPIGAKPILVENQ